MACSDGDDESAPTTEVTTSDSSGGPTTVLFNELEGTSSETLPEGEAGVGIDDETIIATDDGQIPTTTLEPAGTGEDARPDESVTSTTLAPVPPPPAEEISRIVSLSATHTEMLFSMGLGESIVAVDVESDFPAEAVALQRDDIADDLAQIDPILALDPDVVVLGDDPTDIASRLSAQGVATYSGPMPADLAGVFQQFADLAEIVGRPDLAEDVVAAMRADIDEIIASLPPADADGTRGTFFFELDPSLFSVNDDTFVSNLLEELGLVNIVTDGDPFVQVAPDAVVAADPDVIVLGDAECCGVTLDVVAARPGWSDIAAVQSGAVVSVGDDIRQRWGPRLVDMLRTVAGGIIAAN